MKSTVASVWLLLLAVTANAQLNFVRTISAYASKASVPATVLLSAPSDGIPVGRTLYLAAGVVNGDLGNAFTPAGESFLPLITQFPFGNASYCSPRVIKTTMPIAGNSMFSIEITGNPTAIAIQILEFSGASLSGDKIDGTDGFFGQGVIGTGNIRNYPSSGNITTTFSLDLAIGTLIANEPVEFGIGLSPGFTECGRIGTTGGATTSNVVIETQWRTITPGVYSFSPTVQKIAKKSQFNWACFITAIPGT